ncbi:MAG: DUF6134 family protein [Chitinophagales bacterium]
MFYKVGKGGSYYVENVISMTFIVFYTAYPQSEGRLSAAGILVIMRYLPFKDCGMKWFGVVLCLWLQLRATAEEVVFDMSAFGIHFGKMTVTRTRENDSTEVFRLHAKGYLKVLWMERNDETKYEARYVHSQLQSSLYRQYESGKLTKWTDIMLNGQQYQVKSWKGNRTFTAPPRYSVLHLYFEHPQQRTSIFSETDGGFEKVAFADSEKVELKTSDGNRSLYHFINGVLRSIEVHLSIATVHMQRIN